MAQLKVGSDGFYHPSSEEEVRELILLANSKGLKIRARTRVRAFGQSRDLYGSFRQGAKRNLRPRSHARSIELRSEKSR